MRAAPSSPALKCRAGFRSSGESPHVQGPFSGVPRLVADPATRTAAQSAALGGNAAARAACALPIGTARFELATPRSQSECATRLRHVPCSECRGGAEKVGARGARHSLRSRPLPKRVRGAPGAGESGQMTNGFQGFGPIFQIFAGFTGFRRRSFGKRPPNRLPWSTSLREDSDVAVSNPGVCP